MIEAALKVSSGRVSGPTGAAAKLRDTKVYAGIEDSIARDQQESFQELREFWKSRLPQITLGYGNVYQVGKLSFFKNAANRGSLCKLFNRGSTFVSITPPSRWV